MITLTASFIFLGLAGTAEAVSTGTFGLGFTTLPVVFAHMGPLGNFIGATWFLMLFLAAITSSLSMYQPSLAFFQESLGIARKSATTLVVAICMVGSFLVIYFSKNGELWNTLDFWVGTFLIFVMAALQIIAFAWFFGVDKGLAEAHAGAQLRIPGPLRFVMKYVSPVYLIVVFVGFCWQNLPGSLRGVAASPVAQLGVAMIVAVTVFLLWCVRVGERRWRAEGLDIDNRQPLEPGG
jgi:SNF family Na+-dependent transporter